MNDTKLFPDQHWPDAQQSEVHETTADASTAPTVDGEVPFPGHTHPNAPKINGDKVDLPPLSPDTVILRDDTDVGGPLVIQTPDPDLNPPQVPKDPFPTDGTPQIDVPV